jgi:hypothetical protein
MSFPWLDVTPPRAGRADRTTEVARAELVSRAAARLVAETYARQPG